MEAGATTFSHTLVTSNIDTTSATDLTITAMAGVTSKVTTTLGVNFNSLDCAYSFDSDAVIPADMIIPGSYSTSLPLATAKTNHVSCDAVDSYTI